MTRSMTRLLLLSRVWRQPLLAKHCFALSAAVLHLLLFRSLVHDGWRQGERGYCNHKLNLSSWLQPGERSGSKQPGLPSQRCA